MCSESLPYQVIDSKSSFSSLENYINFWFRGLNWVSGSLPFTSMLILNTDPLEPGSSAFSHLPKIMSPKASSHRYQNTYHNEPKNIYTTAALPYQVRELFFTVTTVTYTISQEKKNNIHVFHFKSTVENSNLHSVILCPKILSFVHMYFHLIID